MANEYLLTSRTHKPFSLFVPFSSAYSLKQKREGERGTWGKDGEQETHVRLVESIHFILEGIEEETKVEDVKRKIGEKRDLPFEDINLLYS